jgi:hypothetical protein
MSLDDANKPTPPRPGQPTDPDTDRADDQAVRDAIARILSDEAISIRSEADREARFAEVREQIKAGGYISEEVIRGVVDKLLKDWRL